MAPPVPLAGFPGIPYEYVEMLKARGISTTTHFLQITGSARECILLARSTGIPEDRIREILALCDLARIKGMEPAVARGLYRAGIRSLFQMAGENSDALWGKIEDRSGASDALSGLTINDIAHYIRCAEIIADSDRKQPE